MLSNYIDTKPGPSAVTRIGRAELLIVLMVLQHRASHLPK